jgi:hypothetical protein
MQVLGPLLKRLLPNVTYYAQPGWSVKRWAAAPPKVTADRVIVVLGGNDREISKTYAATLKKFLSTLQGKEVLWFGPSQAKGEIGAWHERTRQLQKSLLPEMGVRWIDSSPWTGSDYRSDGVHFTSKGYQRWAEGISGAVSQAGTAQGSVIPWVGGGLLVAYLLLRRYSGSGSAGGYHAQSGS